MMHYNELAPAQPALVSHADRLRLAAAAYLARFKGTPRPRRLRSALLSRLVRRARPGPVPGPAPAPGAVHPVDAGGPPVQALDGVPAFLGHRAVLPDLRHRRRAGALTRRACPPPGGSRRVTDARIHAPAVRGPAYRRPRVRQPERFVLVAMLGLLGLRIFEATSADIADLGEEHGHRVLRVCGKGGKVVLVPLPPAVGRAIDRATDHRDCGPVLLNSHGTRMDRHAATRRLRRLAETARIRTGRTHPHMLRHTFVTTMLDAGVDLRDVQIAARHADPRTTMRYDRARKNLDRHPNYILAAYMASGT